MPRNLKKSITRIGNSITRYLNTIKNIPEKDKNYFLILELKSIRRNVLFLNTEIDVHYDMAMEIINEYKNILPKIKKSKAEREKLIADAAVKLKKFIEDQNKAKKILCGGCNTLLTVVSNYCYNCGVHL